MARLLREVMAQTGGRPPAVPPHLRRIIPTIVVPTDELPIDVQETAWDKVTLNGHTVLSRVFLVEDPTVLRLLIVSLLDLQDELGHHGRLTIDDKKLRIDVWTHGVDDITEMDTDYTRCVDEIYQDVFFHHVMSAE